MNKTSVEDEIQSIRRVIELVGDPDGRLLKEITARERQVVAPRWPNVLGHVWSHDVYRGILRYRDYLTYLTVEPHLEFNQLMAEELLPTLWAHSECAHSWRYTSQTTIQVDDNQGRPLGYVLNTAYRNGWESVQGVLGHMVEDRHD